MSEPAHIKTDRLWLTPLRPHDAEELAAALANEAIYEFIGGRPESLEALRDRYGRLATAVPEDSKERWLNWVVREVSTGVAIGTVQATVTGAAAVVAWIIGVPWQGCGFAKEAARALVQWLEGLGVEAISAHVHPDHMASAAVAAAAGLAPTADRVDSEVVWRRSAPSRVVGLNRR